MGRRNHHGRHSPRSPKGDLVEDKLLAGPKAGKKSGKETGKNFGAKAKKPESDDRPLPKRPTGHLPVAQKKADKRKALLKKLGHEGI